MINVILLDSHYSHSLQCLLYVLQNYKNIQRPKSTLIYTIMTGWVKYVHTVLVHMITKPSFPKSRHVLVLPSRSVREGGRLGASRPLRHEKSLNLAEPIQSFAQAKVVAVVPGASGCSVPAISLMIMQHGSPEGRAHTTFSALLE